MMDLKELNTEELAKRVMAKLKERLAITDLAKQIKNQLALSGALLHGAESLGSRDPMKPKDCSKDANTFYNCPIFEQTLFSCDSEKKEYDCPGKQIYSCGKFTCVNEYNCTPRVYDHWCGDDFTCKDFKCAGSHGFFCDDDYRCINVFKCRHCNPKACNNEFPYTRKDDGKGGIDKTPGDFTCGWPTRAGMPPDYDEFACVNIFDCSVKDQFECAESTDFKCVNKENFTCNTQNNKFECEGTYVP